MPYHATPLSVMLAYATLSHAKARWPPCRPALFQPDGLTDIYSYSKKSQPWKRKPLSQELEVAA